MYGLFPSAKVGACRAGAPPCRLVEAAALAVGEVPTRRRTPPLRSVEAALYIFVHVFLQDGLGGGALLGPGRPVPALELGLGFDRSGLVRPQTLHQPSPV